MWPKSWVGRKGADHIGIWRPFKSFGFYFNCTNGSEGWVESMTCMTKCWCWEVGKTQLWVRQSSSQWLKCMLQQKAQMTTYYETFGNTYGYSELWMVNIHMQGFSEFKIWGGISMERYAPKELFAFMCVVTAWLQCQISKSKFPILEIHLHGSSFEWITIISTEYSGYWKYVDFVTF